MRNLTKDEMDRVDFHIRMGDFLGTIATMVDLARQTKTKGQYDALLESAIQQLMYVQDGAFTLKKGYGKDNNR